MEEERAIRAEMEKRFRVLMNEVGPGILSAQEVVIMIEHIRTRPLEEVALELATLGDNQSEHDRCRAQKEAIADSYYSVEFNHRIRWAERRRR